MYDDQEDRYDVPQSIALRGLQTNLTDSMNRTSGTGKFSGYTQSLGSQNTSLNLGGKKMDKEFEYWACLEPEKWKPKTFRIRGTRRYILGKFIRIL